MFHSPQDVAKLLEIKETTLRKYALLLEKHAGFKFNRNKNEQRWYTDKDVIALRRLITLKNGGAMSLVEAADAMREWDRENAITPTVTATQGNTGTPQERHESDIHRELQEVKQLLGLQHKQLERLTKVVEAQNEIIAGLQKLPEPPTQIEAKKEGAPVEESHKSETIENREENNRFSLSNLLRRFKRHSRH